MKRGATTVKPLRERAKSARLHHINNELKWERIITRQLFVLLERIYAICGDDYKIDLTIEGQQVIARVDELEFISTYYEVYKDLPEDSEDRCFGVRLWWKCERCRRVKTSDAIYTDYELGRQLEHFDPGFSHKCTRRK